MVYFRKKVGIRVQGEVAIHHLLHLEIKLLSVYLTNPIVFLKTVELLWRIQTTKIDLVNIIKI